MIAEAASMSYAPSSLPPECIWCCRQPEVFHPPWHLFKRIAAMTGLRFTDAALDLLRRDPDHKVYNQARVFDVTDLLGLG